MRRILCYGDSNTFGTQPIARLGADGAWTKAERWAGVMTAALGPGWDVVVEGLPGRTTVHDDPIEGAHRNGLRMLRGTIESHRPIDLLILCLGTNDTKQRFGLGAFDIAQGLARLLRESQASGHVAKMLAICPPPVKERGVLARMFAGGAARCDGLSALIEGFAAEQGAAVFDAGSLIAVDPLDGVHWSRESHAVLGEALARHVAGMFGDGSPPAL